MEKKKKKLKIIENKRSLASIHFLEQVRMYVLFFSFSEKNNTGNQ